MKEEWVLRLPNRKLSAGRRMGCGYLREHQIRLCYFAHSFVESEKRKMAKK